MAKAVSKLAVIVLSTLIGLIMAEAVLQIHYRVARGQWYRSYARARDINRQMFKWHPYLGEIGRPGARLDDGWFHDNLGYRNSVPLQKPGTRIRIVAVGGSATYGTGVSNDLTWPALLARELGGEYEVYNMALPGYSTVENIIQMALLVPDLSPRIAVFYEGWNDLHTMHVRDLKGDYSDYHGPTVVAGAGELQATLPLQSWLIMVDMLAKVSMKLTFDVRDINPKMQPGAGALTAAIDTRALGLYQRNLNTLIELSRAQRITPVMVPQVLNQAALIGDKPSPWTPYIRARDVPAAAKVYGDTMRSVCQAQHVDFVESVLHYPWRENHFVDQGHLSADGNRALAHLIGDSVTGAARRQQR